LAYGKSKKSKKQRVSVVDPTTRRELSYQYKTSLEQNNSESQQCSCLNRERRFAKPLMLWIVHCGVSPLHIDVREVDFVGNRELLAFRLTVLLRPRVGMLTPQGLGAGYSTLRSKSREQRWTCKTP
jgi:hypothetical protein